MSGIEQWTCHDSVFVVTMILHGRVANSMPVSDITNIKKSWQYIGSQRQKKYPVWWLGLEN